MFVYVLNKKGEPLMPCKPAVARLLLKDRKAKVKTRMPFTIKLVGGTTEYKQSIVGGMKVLTLVISLMSVGCSSRSESETSCPNTSNFVINKLISEQVELSTTRP